MKKNGYMNRQQSLDRLEKIAIVAEYVGKHGGTIEEIARALGMPKSSVQRYLDAVNDPKIRELLKNNKKEGNRRGGQTSQEKYGYSKDEAGHFTGRRK